MEITILIIDDDLDDQEIFREAFLQIGPFNRCLAALSCKDALHSLLTGPDLPDLIILDAYLHDRDGLECLREIKANEKLKAIPVHILDSMYNESTHAEVMGLGAAGYYLKPVLFTEIKSLFKDIQQKISEE